MPLSLDALVPARFHGKCRPAWRGGYYAGENDLERETRSDHGLWRAGNPYLAGDERQAWFDGYDTARAEVSQPGSGAE